MILSELRARAWQIAAILSAVLAVAAIVSFLVVRGNAARDRIRADAAEQRAQKAEGQVATLKEAARRDAVARDATQDARDSAANRQPIQEARAAKVKSYADSAVSPCAADPRIVSELREGTDRVGGAIGRLRGDRQPENPAAGDSDR